MSELVLKDVNKIYPNGFQAVYDFNISIKNGEFIVLVGPSGCGKSTTLRMIAGLEDITKGELLINDKIANQKTPKERGVAMVFQSYALYPQLSVFDNIAFGLNLQGLDEDIIEEKVNQVAKILGLTDYLDRKPRELSGGQRQRVAVGRAIIRKVDIFLMDEPLSNLDAKQRVTMRSEIIDIHRKVGATTIYVTHDQTEAMTMADRIVVMKDGYVQQIGTPEELYFHPVNTFVAGFIGEPPMNFIEGVVKGKFLFVNGLELPLEIDQVSKKLHDLKDGEKVIMGFRPEDSYLDKYNKAGLKLEASLELTELLGDNANAYLTYSGQNIIIKLNPHDIPSKDTKKISFSIPFENIYLFDSKTGNVIL